MSIRGRALSGLAALLFAGFGASVCFAQTLETETARLLPAGWWKTGSAYEFQRSSEGTEAALPFLAEYGVTDNLELIMEPVPYTAIRPKAGEHAAGSGDFEVTLTYRFMQEGRRVPAMAMAGEVKFPTARDTLIGTGKTDYAAYFIASKRLGRFDTHLNLSYTVPGSPAGASLNNLIGYALAAVYRPNDHIEYFAEVFGNTSAGSGGEVGDTAGAAAVVPEASGGELVGTLGVGRYVRSNLLVYLAVSYDNNNALQVRPGLTFRFPTARAGRSLTN